MTDIIAIKILTQSISWGETPMRLSQDQIICIKHRLNVGMSAEPRKWTAVGQSAYSDWPICQYILLKLRQIGESYSDVLFDLFDNQNNRLGAHSACFSGCSQ
jgi:hypothetical protein